MRTKGKIAWAVAVVAVAATVAAGSVYASHDDAVLVGSGVSNLAQRDMRALLLHPDEHPDGKIVELSFAQLATESDAPGGMVWSPASCANYLEMAVPNLYTLNGWMQATDRLAPDFSHDSFFIAEAIQVPGGADLARIRDAAVTCREGTLTLESRVTGRVSYSEVSAPVLQGAKTLQLQVHVTFDKPRDAESAAILARYGYGDGTAAVANLKAAAYVALGDTLLTTFSPDAQAARAMATTMYQRAVAAGIR